MKTHNHVANLIKNSRTNHPGQYSQEEVAALLGLSSAELIESIEGAQKHVPFKVMPKIAKVLNISKEALISASLKDKEESLDRFFAKKLKKEIVYM